VPDQHGAWAMLLLPFAAGTWLAGPAWAHLPLFGLWFVGYLAFYALGRWLRSRRRSSASRPLVVYALATLPFAAATLLVTPALLRWVPAYVPLLAASVWLTARGRERSLANDAATVVAATLMAAVAYDAGNGTDWSALWLVTGVLLAYFLGTVLYVKTMIRERGRRGYVVASVAYHLGGTVGASALAATGRSTWWLPAVWLVLVARAVAGPLVTTRRARPVRPVVVGVGEIVASLVLTGVTLAGVA
jgi:hypothetical protein